MNYIPEPPPVAANINSYEFKEWLNKVQNFYISETGTLLISSLTGLSGRQQLPLTVTYLINESAENPKTWQLCLPFYYNCLGKVYYHIRTPSGTGGNFALGINTGNRYDGTTAGSNTSVTFLSTAVISTEDGWRSFA